MGFPVSARTTGELITASIWNGDVRDTVTTLRAGGIALADQAALDFGYPSSPTQWARIPKGGALQAVRLKADLSGYEFFTPLSAAGTYIAPCGGRISGLTDTIFTDSGVGFTSLYLVPHVSNQVGLFNGATWDTLAFTTPPTLSLSGLTASRPHDLFAYNNAGAVALEAQAWQNALSRYDSLDYQDGFVVKHNDPTRLFVCTFYVKSDGTVDDHLTARLIWNHYNRALRPIELYEATASWTLATAWGYVRGQSTNRVQVVQGFPYPLMSLHASLSAALPLTGTLAFATGIGKDGAGAPLSFGRMHGVVYSGSSGDNTLAAAARHDLDIVGYQGYHTFDWLEYGSNAWTAYGVQTGTYHKVRSGLTGWIEG